MSRRFALWLSPLLVAFGASGAGAADLNRTDIAPGGADFSGIEIGPDLGVALGSAGYYSRILHTNLCDAMEQDYVRAAIGKGLSRAQAMIKHAMANALLPLVTLAGLDLA